MKGLLLTVALLTLTASTPAAHLGAPAPGGTSPSITLRAGRLLDGRGESLPSATLTIEGSRIAAVAPGGTGPVTWDLSGLTVLTGGIDQANTAESPAETALYAAENAFVTMASGITTVQSLGATEDRELRDFIARGILPGPRILTSLTPLDPETGDPDAMRQAVRKRKPKAPT
jgi:imidazolonepropionase-like amidohydrolase